MCSSDLVVAIIFAWLDAAAPALTGAEPWPPALMVGLGVFMVSTIPFRTFKGGRLTRKGAIALFALICATAFTAIQVRPSFAVVALMAMYLVYGCFEWLMRGWQTMRKNAAAPPPGDNVPGPGGQPR